MDWIAGIFELLGSWSIGSKKKIGFVCNLIGCVLWVYVSVTYEIYGLLLVVVPALFINIRNYIKWS
jgi:rRNA processing protein Gar1